MDKVVFDWASFESKISKEVEPLRGDKAFIKLVKEDIKKRVAATRICNRKSRDWESRSSRGLLGCELPDWNWADATSSGLMRHIFLAYAWLRNKPLASIEPRTVAARRCSFSTPKLPTEQWAYWSSYSPDPVAIGKIIESYRIIYTAKVEPVKTT